MKMKGTANKPQPVIPPTRVVVEMSIEEAEVLAFIARHDLTVPDYIAANSSYRPVLSNVAMSTALTDFREALTDALQEARK